ncbi:MAG: ParB/RepB/Spo0J family partition protein [Candidatus Taylorbacteria bacterium]|nr:ParB/RepB/Spo0J family partition protein [Candidatus Taylorbacteria bacterium]
MPPQLYGDSIFWIDIGKIKPNPYQPRREFDDARLKDLAESIRMYGILQPLVVTRNEVYKEDGGLSVEYELISGERRLRASKIAGLSQVPALIRTSIGEDDARVKLELAIIENLQREDLNAVDRARSFDRLAKEFGLKHIQIAEKVGKSREYVSNTMRILLLPDEILTALGEGKISEGHTRPLLMLADHPEEQTTLFKEIIFKKLTVREAEAIARRIAYDRVRKKERAYDPAIVELEEKFKESLGTRVKIEQKDEGGKILIDFFSADDLRFILGLMNSNTQRDPNAMLNSHIAQSASSTISQATPLDIAPVEGSETETPVDDRPKEEKVQDENTEDLYSVKNFGI